MNKFRSPCYTDEEFEVEPEERNDEQQDDMPEQTKEAMDDLDDENHS